MTSRRKRPPIPLTIRLPWRWRRFGPVVILVTLAVGAIAGDHFRHSAARIGNDIGRYHDKSFSVDRVVDGDTVDVAVPDGDRPTTRIRLWGVDCPELARDGKEAMYFGPRAADFARRTLDGRRVNVVLWPDRTRDKYGRLLAYLHLERGGPMFNEMLVENGFAYADTRFDHPFRQRFETTEKLAQRSAVGLWQSGFPPDAPEWRKRP